MLTLMLFLQTTTVMTGLASTYQPSLSWIACPKSSFDKSYPICAHRDLPCGTILNIKRQDTGKITRCVVADRGPYGACVPAAHTKTRSCGQGQRWILKTNKRQKGEWRGILDISTKAAHLLGFSNRLIKVIIWKLEDDVESANINDIGEEVAEDDDPKSARKESPNGTRAEEDSIVN